MNPLNITNVNFTDGSGLAYQYSFPDIDPIYKDYKPPQRELIPLPKAVLYLLMAALVVVAVAYTIVGHIIKDLAGDVADCVLGPDGEEAVKETDLRCISSPKMPEARRHSHANAFRVWDQEDVIINLSPEENPQNNPLLLTAAPYRPYFHTPSSGSPPPSSPGAHPPGVLRDVECATD